MADRGNMSEIRITLDDCSCSSCGGNTFEIGLGGDEGEPVFLECSSCGTTLVYPDEE